jgi:tRNA-2-methylthio-N6-dimethylallyladenosine synthase
MQGCDNFCSYCIVPYVRGPEKSRPSQEILKEIRLLAKEGVKEVILLGQNVNAYGKKSPGECSFVELLRKIAEIPGIERIRFTTSHPKDLGEDLILAFKEIPQLCEHIHLPFQAGSNKILKMMRRGYTREEYLQKIERLREVVPEIAITADVIVGFPGEKEEDFEETLDLVRQVRFDGLFSFKYSPRKGTLASKWPDDVPEEVKARRLEELQSLQRKITLEKNKALEGQVLEVLVEGCGDRQGQLKGRSRCNRVVVFQGPIGLIGKTVWVKIKEGLPNCLRGELHLEKKEVLYA